MSDSKVSLTSTKCCSLVNQRHVIVGSERKHIKLRRGLWPLDYHIGIMLEKIMEFGRLSIMPHSNILCDHSAISLWPDNFKWLQRSWQGLWVVPCSLIMERSVTCRGCDCDQISRSQDFKHVQVWNIIIQIQFSSNKLKEPRHIFCLCDLKHAL